MRTVWQVEIDEYCRRVLAKHWPKVKRYGDIRDCCGWNHRANCPFPSHLRKVDVLTGGFPCQPHSVAGNQLGTEDERWLWPEFRRIICGMGPQLVVVENVPGLLTTAFGEVLGDLAECGYDAEWNSISAAAVGAPHERDRVWIVAYPRTQRREGVLRGLETVGGIPRGEWPATSLDTRCAVIEAIEQGLGEPAIFGTNDGLSLQVEQLASLGNAIVPQIAEWIGRRIVASCE